MSMIAGWVRQTDLGYVVLDDEGTTLMGPDELKNVVAWADANYVDIQTEDGHE